MDYIRDLSKMNNLMTSTVTHCSRSSIAIRGSLSISIFDNVYFRPPNGWSAEKFPSSEYGLMARS
jgi:hypothetical protein